MEALKTIETANGNLTKNDFKEMNTDQTETTQSNRVKDVEALREMFDKEIEIILSCYVDESFLLEQIKDGKVLDLMFQEYDGDEGIMSTNTFATLQAVRRLDDYLRTDFSEPQRTARAINSLLCGVNPYIKRKVLNELVKDNYCGLTEGDNYDPVWLKIKSMYDIELLAPKEVNN